MAPAKTVKMFNRSTREYDEYQYAETVVGAKPAFAVAAEYRAKGYKAVADKDFTMGGVKSRTYNIYIRKSK